MKIIIIVSLCLVALIMGCSHSSHRTLSLWQERQMDDDQRIHGNPYEMPKQWQGVWMPTLY